MSDEKKGNGSHKKPPFTNACVNVGVVGGVPTEVVHSNDDYIGHHGTDPALLTPTA